MKKYNELKDKIVDYLLMDDVDENDEVISVSTLLSMMAMKFDELKWAYNTRNLVMKVNTISSSKKKNMLNSLKDSIGLEVHEPKCKYIIPRICKKKNSDECEYLKISFWYDNGEFKDIYKRIGDKRLYSSKRSKMVDSKVLKECIFEISCIFKTLEEFVLLFQKASSLSLKDSSHYCFHQNISGEDFNVKIECDSLGNLTNSISFNEKNDSGMISEKQLDKNNKTISDILLINKMQILDKIPISVNDLNPICRKVYESYKDTYQKIKFN